MRRAEFFTRLSPIFNKEELLRIYDAYWISKNTHHKQKRDSGGKRFFEHPRAVAIILVEEFGVRDADTIIIGLLHDALEDTFVSENIIEKVFGNSILQDIQRLSKCSVLIHEKTGEIAKKKKSDYVKNLAGERVIAVKAADRLHNLRTIQPWKKIRKVRYLQETKDDLVPKVRAINPLFSLKLEEEIIRQEKNLTKTGKRA